MTILILRLIPAESLDSFTVTGAANHTENYNVHCLKKRPLENAWMKTEAQILFKNTWQVHPLQNTSSG